MEEFVYDLSYFTNKEIADEYFSRGLNVFEDNLDHLDLELLRQIKEKFFNSTWAEKQQIHKTIITQSL